MIKWLAVIALVGFLGHGTQADDALPPVKITAFAENVWIHSSYALIEPWGPVVSNGLIVKIGERILLVDTAWDVRQTQDILDWVNHTFGRMVDGAVITHAHDDKMGGMPALRAAGVPSYAFPRSNLIAPARGLLPADSDLVVADSGDAMMPILNWAADSVDIFYPGPGHSVGNVVVHVRAPGLVFAGCLIRPEGSGTLGNTDDADMAHWATAVAAVARRFPDAGTVIVSHGDPAGRTLYSDMISLIRNALD